MKLPLLAVYGFGIASASEPAKNYLENSCYSFYDTTSVVPIPTISTTYTSNYTPVDYVNAGTVTTTVTLYTTSSVITVIITNTETQVVTMAPSTTTVPTNPGFTPASSASTRINPPPDTRRKRSPRPRPRHRSNRTRQLRQRKDDSLRLPGARRQDGQTYVTEVECAFYSYITASTTITYIVTNTDSIYVTASTPSIYTSYEVTASTTTSTLQTAVATKYQGCQVPANIVQSFDGQPVYDSYPGSGQRIVIGSDVVAGNSYYGPPTFYDTGDQGSIQSSTDCCNAAFAMDCSGWDFTYYPYSGGDRTCSCLTYTGQNGPRLWTFFTQPYSYDNDDRVVVVGNGPSGVPVYGGQVNHYSS